MPYIPNATTEPQDDGEIEITSEMIEAGADVILCEVGGADLGGLFSADDLATRVYRAMDNLRSSTRTPLYRQRD
jgi:basic membrane lipoprotein Med (substrate-binding protein (PBP1-ABC) superfamily)